MIALIGPGNARDHCVAARLAAERGGRGFRCYLTGGNALLAGEAWTCDCTGMPVEAVARAAAGDGATLAVILDPLLLIAGAADHFIAAGIPTCGPTRAAAIVEGSKAAMKQVLAAAGAATPESFVAPTQAAACAILEREWQDERPLVLKTDHYLADANLRALVPESRAQAIEGVRRQFSALDQAGSPAGLVIERRISGWETSVHVLWDGRDYLMLPPVRDYKRARNGDCGPNTHGTGAIAYGGGSTPTLETRLRRDVIEPVLDAMARRGLAYPGIVYFGTMIDAAGVPRLLEINVRPGNPEMLALIGLLRSELGDLLERCVQGTLGGARAKWSRDYCGALFAMAEGYPEQEQVAAVPIVGLEREGRRGSLFGEGIGRAPDGSLRVAGGRVAAAVATGDSIASVRETLLADLATIDFAGKHYRSDLGSAIGDGLFAPPGPAATAA